MKYNSIIIEESEFALLKNLFSKEQHDNDKIYNLSVRRLKKELEAAKVVAAEFVPDDVIRINSIVTVKMSSKLTRTFKLVVPEKSDLMQDKLSVMSPMGLALFGYAANDQIEWQFPSGNTKIRILKVISGISTEKPANKNS